MPAQLTLVVFLKDRPEFTKRFCDYLSTIRYPYPVYFADGSIDSDTEVFFKNFKTNDFVFTYTRYPRDVTLQDYYKKCYQSVREVKTPYVMFADNDDFPIPRGQIKALEFLEINPDFIGCNGRVGGLSISPDSSQPYGERVCFHQYYCSTMDLKVPLNQSSAEFRIESYLKNFYSIFYSVFRKESLIQTQEFIKELNFSELGVHELFFSYMQLAQGKIHTINDVTYIRQKGSSQAAASQKDWFYRLFYTDWFSDCRNAIHAVSEYISQVEKLEHNIVYDLLYKSFVNKMRSRYLPNSFYLFKNFSSLSIKNIGFNKVLKWFPAFAEQLSYKMFTPDQIRSSDLNKIKKIISP